MGEKEHMTKTEEIVRGAAAIGIMAGAVGAGIAVTSALHLIPGIGVVIGPVIGHKLIHLALHGGSHTARKVANGESK